MLMGFNGSVANIHKMQSYIWSEADYTQIPTYRLNW